LTARLPLLVEGVQRPDRAPSTPPAEQKRHALRRENCQPTRAALDETREHLRELHGRALTAGGGRDTWLWLGEALHLIQDSYSPAHTERMLGDNHPIIYIRSYRHGVLVGPTEHLYPVDPRDSIRRKETLPWVACAESTSVEYLEMAKRHLARRWTPSEARADLVRFMDRHLSLSPSHRNPADYHRACRPKRRA
jgi:hypothetical protein